MNFRYLLFVGDDDRNRSGFGSRIYILGLRARTVYYAYGACDFQNRRAHPKWLQHGKKVFHTEVAARDYATKVIADHENRGYSNLKVRQKPRIDFDGRQFTYHRSDGTTTTSSARGH